jgi:hypothetical protein
MAVYIEGTVAAETISGTDYAYWAIPHHPTAPPAMMMGKKYNTKEFRRMGVIMSVLDYGAKYTFTLQWQYLTSTEVSGIRDWIDRRTFRFYYNCTEESGGDYVSVYAHEKNFQPIKKRGDMWGLVVKLEEL